MCKFGHRHVIKANHRMARNSRLFQHSQKLLYFLLGSCAKMVHVLAMVGRLLGSQCNDLPSPIQDSNFNIRKHPRHNRQAPRFRMLTLTIGYSELSLSFSFMNVFFTCSSKKPPSIQKKSDNWICVIVIKAGGMNGTRFSFLEAQQLKGRSFLQYPAR